MEKPGAGHRSLAFVAPRLKSARPHPTSWQKFLAARDGDQEEMQGFVRAAPRPRNIIHREAQGVQNSSFNIS